MKHADRSEEKIDNLKKKKKEKKKKTDKIYERANGRIHEVMTKNKRNLFCISR